MKPNQVKKKNNVSPPGKGKVKPPENKTKKIVKFVLIGLAILSLVLLIAALQKLPHLDFDDSHKHKIMHP